MLGHERWLLTPAAGTTRLTIPQLSEPWHLRDWLSGNFPNHDISCDSVWSNSAVVAVHFQEILVLHFSLHQDSQNPFLVVQQNQLSSHLGLAGYTFAVLLHKKMRGCRRHPLNALILVDNSWCDVHPHHMYPSFTNLKASMQMHCCTNRIETKVKKQRLTCNKCMHVIVRGHMCRFVVLEHIEKIYMVCKHTVCIPTYECICMHMQFVYVVCI